MQNWKPLRVTSLTRVLMEDKPNAKGGGEFFELLYEGELVFVGEIGKRVVNEFQGSWWQWAW